MRVVCTQEPPQAIQAAEKRGARGRDAGYQGKESWANVALERRLVLNQ